MSSIPGLCAGCTRRGVSSVLGALLVLAVLSTVVTSVIVYYLPIIKKNAEFKHENELIDRFLEIVNGYPNCDIALQLGGGETLFNPLKTSATIETNVSGYVSLELLSNATFSRKIRLGCVNLTIYNTRIANVALTYSDGGVVLFQGNRSMVLKPPTFDKSVDIIEYGRNITIVLYNFTSPSEEIAGNGFGYISVRAALKEKLEFHNVTLINITVNDRIFQKYWGNYLESFGFKQVSSNSWILTTLSNVTIVEYKVSISLY